jgi:hypothetical protein
MAIRVGDVGRALSPMSPSGAVEVNGERLDARSDGPFIEAGSPVVVLRGDPTGYVVRKLEPGHPQPELPGHGEPIRKAEFQRNSAEAAGADRQERAEARRRFLKGLQYGSIAAASLGAIVGLTSGGTGWYFGWAAVADPLDGALLLAGWLFAGAATGVALFFVTGLIGVVLGFVTEGEASFTPDFFIVFASLVGAAVGFWWDFRGGDAGTATLWAIGGVLVFGVVACVLSWLARKVLESVAGV